MMKSRKIRTTQSLVCGAFLAAVVLSLLQPRFAHAENALAAIPEGFEEVSSAPGTTLYRKEYTGGKPDYVQVASFGSGASAVLLHGDIADAGSGQGIYGGSNPTFARQTIEQMWDEASSAHPELFCAVNGSFFSTDVSPTPLAFPLKVDGEILSDGYGGNEFPDQKLMLEIWQDHVDISPLTREALYGSEAPNILAGLSETADKGPGVLTGRTFAGAADPDKDGTYDTLLIFSSELSTQPGAAQILRSFGAEKVIMLDGGGSTQLHCGQSGYILSSRTVPQVLAVLSKPVAEYAAQVTEQPQWPVLVQGESLEVSLVIENTGTQSWKAGETSLVNRQNPWGAAEEFLIQNDVSPGGTATFTWTTNSFESSGVFTSSWGMVHDGQAFEERVSINVIVIPKELADKKAELEQKVKEWLEEKETELKELIVQWIKEQTEKAARGLLDKICGTSNAGLAIGVLLLAILRGRRLVK